MRGSGVLGVAIAGLTISGLGLLLTPAPNSARLPVAVAAGRQATPQPADQATPQPAVGPTAAFGDPGDFTIGSPGAVAADGPQAGATYSWDFGDGTTATGVSAQHVYHKVDDYTVQLSVRDARGNVNTASRAVRAVPALGLLIGDPALNQIVPASQFAAGLDLDASGPTNVSIKIGGTYLSSTTYSYDGAQGGALFQIPVISVVNEDDPDIDANLIEQPGASIPLQGNVQVTVSYAASSGKMESVTYATSLQKPTPVAAAAPAPTGGAAAAGAAAGSPTPTPAPASDAVHGQYEDATPSPTPSPTVAPSPRANVPASAAPAAATPSPTAQPTPAAAAQAGPPPVWQITYPTYLPVVGYPVNADDVDNYYIKGDPEFHAVTDPLLRRYAIKIARAGGVFPNDPQVAADNIYHYVYGLLGIGDPGELQTDIVILNRVVRGALVPGARSGQYICIAHAYFLSSLTRTLGLPTREETVGFGRGIDQDSTGAWRLTFYQEGANEVWYNGDWHHYDTWIGTRNRDDYLATNLTEVAWYAYSQQSTPFTDVNGTPVGLDGHDFSMGKYVGIPGSPDQWRFLEQHTRPGIRIADPGPDAYASADRADPAPRNDLVQAGILPAAADQSSGQ